MPLKIPLFILFLTLLSFTPVSCPQAAEKPSLLMVGSSSESSIVTHRIINTALKRLGYQMLLRQGGMRTLAAETDSGDLDLLAEMVEGTETGHNNLVRVPVSFSSTKITVYVREDSKISVGSWEDLRSLRVAYRNQNLYLANNVPKRIPVNISTSSYDELWRQVLDNNADAAIAPHRENSGRIVPKGIKKAGVVQVIPNYPYLNKKHATLVPLLAETIREMQDEGTIENLKKWSLSPGEKTVVHITSYNSEIAWEKQMNEGVRQAIHADGIPAAVFGFNLSSRRVSNKDMQRASVASAIHAALLDRNPDVVVASDNDALEFVHENYHRLFIGAPVVFCGINNFTPAVINGIEQYATGCTESISVSATVQYMLWLYPRAKKIYVINDYSNSGRLWQKDIKNQLSRLNMRVDVEYNDNMPKELLLKKLASFGSDTLVLLGSYFTDSENNNTEEAEMQRQISAVLSTPLFVLISSHMGEGAFGGMLAHGRIQGATAGKMAARILRGEQISDIPIIYASESLNKWVFDASVAKKFNLTETNMPEGHELINNPDTSWQLERKRLGPVYLGFAAMFLACAAAILLYKRSRAKKAGMSEQCPHDFGNDAESSGEIIKRLEKIMEKAPFAFAAVSDGRIVEANDYSRHKIGMVLGGDIHNFYKNPGSYDKAVKALDDRGAVSGEVTLFNMADGETHRHHVNYVPFEHEGRHECLAFAIDIEELERQKDYTRRSQEDLQKILDAMPTAMAIINTISGNLEYANKGFLGFYGYRTVQEASPEDFLPLVEQIFAAWQGRTIVFEYNSNKCGTGKRNLNLKMYADQIIFRGHNCIVLIGQDITSETRQAEMLTRAAEKEKEANLLKSIFLANMSHEIRTPMNAIIGLSQLALMREQSNENNELFHKIRSSAKNLLSIINDILDFSKIEAEKLDFVEDIFSLEETIINTFLVATERLEDKQVEILLDLAPDVPFYLIGDNTRLWQVLKNLLDNSVKYTPSGRIILSISTLESKADRVTLVFHIKDTGVGLNAGQLERLFAPFEQFHRMGGSKSGTGLGMSITKKLVDIMGGEIRVESEVNVGTDFYVTIPFKRAKNQKTMGDSMRETIGGRSEHVNSILLVDDDEYSLAIMSAILKNAGISSSCARDSAQALSMVLETTQNGTPYSVIILDYLLGEENGIDLARKINEISQNTKLLLVTAYLKRVVSPELLAEVGFRDVIEKPYVVSTFLQKVCSVLPEITAAPRIRIDKYPNARVLLCEDNDINQQVASGMLEHFGIIPAIAGDGAEALDILERERFDLILMDIMMPVMNGRDATKAIRHGGKPWQDIPIVAMTANVMVDDVELYLSEGMNAHLEKPIDIEKFQDILARYLG